MRRYGVVSGQLNGYDREYSLLSCNPLFHIPSVDLGDGEVDQHVWAEAGQTGGNELDQSQCIPPHQYMHVY